MTPEPSRLVLPPVLDAVFDAWDRNNTVLVNLLRAIPAGGLDARATATSPTVAQMFAHVHHERLASVSENAPECAGEVLYDEWAPALDVETMAALLLDSGKRVRQAVEARIHIDRGFDCSYAHPIQLVPFLIFHEAYHHGQIKLALKAAGCPISDDLAGPLTWDVWRAR